MCRNSDVSKILRELRGPKSIYEVAAAVGVSITAMCMYEIGERIPRDEIKIKIAEYYNKKIEDIFEINV